MSKASKLARMRNTVLESTGLSYNNNTPGETVELNFFPDSTNSGVSVPLVVSSSSSGPSVPNKLPRTGYPYARLEHNTPNLLYPGELVYRSNSTEDGVTVSSDSYWRSRPWNSKPRDEIGINCYQAPSGPGNGGPGHIINFPIGIYRIVSRLCIWQTRKCASALFNFTDNEFVVMGTGSKTGFVSTSGSETSESQQHISGEFEVTSPGTSYVIIQAGDNTQTTASDLNQLQLGWPTQMGTISSSTGIYNLSAQAEFWKLR